MEFIITVRDDTGRIYPVIYGILTIESALTELSRLQKDVPSDFQIFGKIK